MMQKSAFAFQHPPANSFRVPGLLPGHIVNPAMSNDGKCSRLQPPLNLSLPAKLPSPAPCCRVGFPASSAFSLTSHSPSVAPQPLGSGLASSLAPLVQPTECRPHMSQVFRSGIHELWSSWGCSCFGSREKVRKVCRMFSYTQPQSWVRA